MPPHSSKEIDSHRLADTYDLLDVTACDSSLHLAYEAGRTSARSGELSLGESEFQSAGAHYLSQIVSSGELPIRVARLGGK